MKIHLPRWKTPLMNILIIKVTIKSLLCSFKWIKTRIQVRPGRIKKPNSGPILIYTCSKNTSKIRKNLKVLLYRSYICPVMTYVVTIILNCAKAHLRKLQGIQIKCLRMALSTLLHKSDWASWGLPNFYDWILHKQKRRQILWHDRVSWQCFHQAIRWLFAWNTSIQNQRSLAKSCLTLIYDLVLTIPSFFFKIPVFQTFSLPIHRLLSKLNYTKKHDH